jgi:hypothetical protein
VEPCFVDLSIFASVCFGAILRSFVFTPNTEQISSVAIKCIVHEAVQREGVCVAGLG